MCFKFHLSITYGSNSKKTSDIKYFSVKALQARGGKWFIKPLLHGFADEKNMWQINELLNR